MSSWKNLAAWRPVYLIILLALHTAAAIVRHPGTSFSLGAPELIARAEESATLEPYIGTGAVPTPKAWSLLSSQGVLQYSPTDSNITIRLTQKGSAAHEISSPLIYNLTVQGLAEIASLVVTSNGDEDIPNAGQENSTFTTSDATSSGLHFMMTSSGSLPVYAVADVLRGMQELTHYLLFLEFTFEVLSQTSPTFSPLASGYLSFFLVSFHNEKVQKRGLELVDPSVASSSVTNSSVTDSSITNSSTTNTTIDTSRELLSPVAPIQLVEPSTNKGKTVSVTYEAVKDAIEVYDQSYADVATRILSNVTNLIIANHGDGLIPSPGPPFGRVLHAEDTWGSTLTVSLLPINRSGAGFTLGQAAMALQAIQNKLSDGPVMESKLAIRADNMMIGWGCMTYANGSSWRCIQGYYV